MDVQLDDRKEEILSSRLQSLGLTLTKSITAFEMDIVPKGNFVFSDGFTTYSTKPPRKNTKKYGDIMFELVSIKSYLETFGSRVSSDNFLNTYETLDKNSDNDAIKLSQQFLASDSKLKGLWLHGESGIGKSHLLQSMIYRMQQDYVRSEFKKLDSKLYSECNTYLKDHTDGNHSTYDHPEQILINYMGKKQKFSSSNLGRGSRVSDFNSLMIKEAFFFLDDVCSTESEAILDSLINIYEKRSGRFVITSNQSMGEWIEKINSSSSYVGIMGRLETYIKEVEVQGNSRRISSW